MLKFDNDTTVICPTKQEEYGKTLQAYLYSMMDWSNQWQMQCNIEKCKVMHFCYNNNVLNTQGEEKR